VTWLFRNWHLKLGAVALATVLYTGFVYSGSFSETTFPGAAIEAINQPDSAYPLTQNLGTVDIRYRLSSDAGARVTADSFAVTVDLAEYDMDQAPEQQALAVSVRPLTDGLQVLDFAPRTVPVAIDRIGQKEVPVVVDRGQVPEGFAIGTPQVSNHTVVASGPESQLALVERAVATVQIFASGIDVQRQVDLQPVDVDGRQVELVELDPATVTVEIDVRAVETSKSVAVIPALSGKVADGYEVAAVSVEPQIVTLFGQADALGAIDEVSTLPVNITGLSATTTLDAQLALPPDTRLAGGTTPVQVTVEVQAATATRTMLLGVVCQGAAAGVACLPGQQQLSVTLSGPAAVLSGINAADVTPAVDVSGLDPGTYQLNPVVTLPDGIELVSMSPGTISVTLRAPATPAPSPSG
jgi:YbbR domain-containing protein